VKIRRRNPGVLKTFQKLVNTAARSVSPQLGQAQDDIAFRGPNVPTGARFLTFVATAGISSSFSAASDSLFVPARVFRL
jgi:hypothetical protein